MTSLAAAVGGLSFFTSARGTSSGSSTASRDSKTPLFGVCDMTTGTVLTHLALSPIQYKPTQDGSLVATSAKETLASTTAGAGAGAGGGMVAGKDGGNERGGGTIPSWEVVDVRSLDGGFWIAEVGGLMTTHHFSRSFRSFSHHFSRIIPSFSHHIFRIIPSCRCVIPPLAQRPSVLP